MSELKNIMKLWLTSLSLFDNCYFNASIIIILVLYSSLIFENINIYVSELYNYSIVRLIVLFLIIYIAPKDPTISILLGISYLVSIYYMSNDINSILDTNNNGKIDSMEKELYKLNNKIENFQPMQVDEILNNPAVQNVLKNPTVQNVLKNPTIQDLANSNPVLKSVVDKISEPFTIIGNTSTSNQKISAGLLSPKKVESFTNNFLLTNKNNIMNDKSDKLDKSNNCQDLHIQKYDQLENICEPVKLFDSEYNVQGLNSEIMGQNINYHPVGSNI
jgi:hypothetical protein